MLGERENEPNRECREAGARTGRRGSAAARRPVDMLHGPLAGKLIGYALPLAATSVLQQIFNAADVAVVGRFVGNEAMAAVGCAGPIVSLLVSFFVGTSLGSTVVIATAVGGNQSDLASRAVHTSLLFALLGGLAASLLCELFAADVLRMMNVPGSVFPMALLYLRIYFAGVPVIVLYNFEAAIFRSVGDTKGPLIVLVFSGLLNVALNLLFVFALDMTVDGVAIATVVSNGVSFLLLLLRLLRTDSEVRLHWRQLRIDGESLKKVLQIGLPAGLQNTIFAFSNIIVQYAVNSLGTVVMAASSAALYVETYAHFMLSSFGQACTTFVGQNNGAGNLPRCRRILRVSLALDFAFTGAACCFVLLCGRPILSLFTADPEVIETAYLRVRVILFAFLFGSLFQEMFSDYLRGFSISLTPTLISIAGICGIRTLMVCTYFRAAPSFFRLLMVYPVSLCTTGAVMAVTALVVERRLIRSHAEAATDSSSYR